MSSYKIIDHTSDIGIKIEAGSLERLFTEAIKGLFFLITDRVPGDVNIRGFKVGRKRVRIKYKIIDSALIELLNKIIFFCYSRGILFFNPSVKIKRNKIVLKSSIIKNAFSLMEREIKAATYHDFSIKNDEGFYYTSIIFDI